MTQNKAQRSGKAAIKRSEAAASKHRKAKAVRQLRQDRPGR